MRNHDYCPRQGGAAIPLSRWATLPPTSPRPASRAFCRVRANWHYRERVSLAYGTAEKKLKVTVPRPDSVDYIDLNAWTKIGAAAESVAPEP